ncbi:hypothetical protein ACP4OV_024444 [Aristida adscensionis]
MRSRRVNEEASNKVLEVEQKYNEIRRPVYVRRNEIIKNIPDFWLTAFLSHPMLGELLAKDDQTIFKHLESIDVDESEDIKSGCSITFAFSANPYFDDKRLTKTYSISDDGTISVKATSIKWKARMDIVNGKTCMKKGAKRLLVHESGLRNVVWARQTFQQLFDFKHLVAGSLPGFFTWFSDTKNKSLDHNEMDEVVDVIKEDLWPNPLKYFNNELEDKFEIEDDDKEGSDEEEDQDEGEEDGEN